MSTSEPFLSVAELRALLADPRLQDTDLVYTLTLAQTGNLTLVRDGDMIGWIEIRPGAGSASYLELIEEQAEGDEGVDVPLRDLEVAEISTVTATGWLEGPDGERCSTVAEFQAEIETYQNRITLHPLGNVSVRFLSPDRVATRLVYKVGEVLYPVVLGDQAPSASSRGMDVTICQLLSPV